jgi:hypothetical protein
MRLIFPSRRVDIHLLWLFYTLGIVAVAVLGLWSFLGQGAIALVTAFALSVPAALFVIFAGRTRTRERSLLAKPRGTKPPIHMPFFFEAAILSRMRSPVTSRST